MNNKRVYLDWIRVFAVFLVLYGHLANAASWITQETTVFSEEYVLPINDGTTHRAYLLDVLLGKFNAASAVIGVVLFFWLTGYLTAMTREKYSGKAFLVRRIVRLYPGLIISVTICGIVAACMGVKHSAWEYVANGLLLYMLMGSGATIGTLWTLVVELFFYCIVVHFVRLDFKKIMIIDGSILILTLSQALTSQGSYTLMYVLKYVPIILFGSMMYEFHRVKGLKRYAELVLAAVMAYLIPYIGITYTYKEEQWYKSLMSYVFALIIWAFFYLLDKFCVKFAKALNKFIKFIVDTSYLVYLLQLNIGYTIMYFLRELGVRGGINIICGVMGTFAVSAVVHYLLEKPIQNYLSKKVVLWENSKYNSQAA